VTVIASYENKPKDSLNSIVKCISTFSPQEPSRTVLAQAESTKAYSQEALKG